MTEVIVFGGSFNPPTHAHAEVVKNCLEQPEIDEVWVMPSGARTDKAFSTTDQERMDMLHIMKNTVFRGDSRLVISDFELQLPRPTETYQTLGALGMAYPETKFWFAFGADAYRGMPAWENGQEMQDTLPMYLLPRDGDIPPDAPNVRHLPPLRQETSSTLAREAVVTQQPLEQFVPVAIAQHIQRQQLYVAV